MTIGELRFTGELSGSVIGAPGIEYVIIANLKSGGIVAFPASRDPFSNPQYVAVEEPVATAQAINATENFGELVILTPEPGESLPYGDPMIVAVSLFTLENVDVNSVRVFFDNIDVTAYSLITTDLITYKPDVLTSGKHNIFMEISNIYGVRLTSSSWSFNVHGQTQKIFEMGMDGSLNINHRQDKISFSNTDVDTVIGTDTVSVPLYSKDQQSTTRVDFLTNLNFDWAKVKIFSNITSKEDSTLQPQNRYGVKVRTSWLKYSYGDETPMMNRLGLWGKRVRGHNVDVRFKGFNVHVVSGTTARSITGTASFDSLASTWNRTGYSYERGVFAIRPSIGRGKTFQFGVFYVHTRDSVNTVTTKPNYWDGNVFSQDLIGETKTVTVPFGAETFLFNDSTYSVNYELAGSTPEDNIVFGSDVKLALDNHRFIVQASTAFSLYNRNIIDGPLTRVQLDTFSLLADTTIDDTLGSGVLDIGLSGIDESLAGSGLGFLLTDGKFDPANLSDIFILNENLTLPVDITNLDEKNYLAAMTTVAINLAIKLNYYNHFVHIDYHHIGPGYKALGSPSVRLDSKGWSGWKITDKVRMFNNMLYLNLGWESHKNNTISIDDVVDPRLVQNTFTTGITLNPGQGLPTVTTSMKYFTRDNNVDQTTSIEQTLASGADTVIVVDNRELNELLSSNVSLTYILRFAQIENTIAFNVMSSDMNNLVIGYQGLLRSSNLYGLNLRTEWGIPLTTTLSIRNNTNQLYDESNPNFQSNIFNTIRLGSSYSLFAGKLILRGSYQHMIFESNKYESSVLTKTSKTQKNIQFNTQYNFIPLSVGNTSIKSRLMSSFEQRQYTNEFSEYSDRLISARFELVF
jgi:hypothetical protein